jgi:hypothetical protein
LVGRTGYLFVANGEETGLEPTCLHVPLHGPRSPLTIYGHGGDGVASMSTRSHAATRNTRRGPSSAGVPNSTRNAKCGVVWDGGWGGHCHPAGAVAFSMRHGPPDPLLAELFGGWQRDQHGAGWFLVVFVPVLSRGGAVA